MREPQREVGVDARMTTEYPATPATAAPQGIRRWLPLFLIVGLFFLWGGANNLNDVLIAQFKKAFVLNDFQAGLVQSAFYLGYFLVAMPAAMFMRRYGYKQAVVLGLALYGAGALLFWPAAQLRTWLAERTAPDRLPRFLDPQDAPDDEERASRDPRAREQRQFDVLMGLLLAGVRSEADIAGARHGAANVMVVIHEPALRTGRGTAWISDSAEPISAASAATPPTPRC